LPDLSRGAGGRPLTATPRVYYGWIVVAGLSITETVSRGILYEPVFWLLAGVLVLAALGLLVAPARVGER
jgi:hypothetical protein